MFLRENIEEINTPGLCALCMGSQLPMVDTLRQNNVNQVSTLRGRQYVCAECMEALGEAFGFPTKADLEAQERKVSYWRRKAQKDADVLQNLREVFKDPDNGDHAPLED